MAEGTLYQKLAEAVGAGDSKDIPGIFETLTDEKEAQVLFGCRTTGYRPGAGPKNRPEGQSEVEAHD